LPALALRSARDASGHRLGKRCALLDLERAGEQHELRGVLGGANLLVQSRRPGAMERAGLGPQDVAMRRQGIVYVSVSCYGYGGPWRERGGFEPIGQTVCGVPIDEGSAAAPKLAPTVTVNDYLTAYLAAAGALARSFVVPARELPCAGESYADIDVSSGTRHAD
jgi:crotonobetainyl-CoA:carnitine CoA-transferase CaiB-like acyl-CoA transferase